MGRTIAVALLFFSSLASAQTAAPFKVNRGIQFSAGSTLPVAPASQARIRYNLSLSRLEYSLDGGAYAALVGAGGSSTLAASYTAGASASDSRLLLDSTRQGFWVQDNASPLSVPLFAITDSAGSFGYFSVRSTRTAIANAAASGATPLSTLLVTPGAHTTATASTEFHDVDLNLARTVQWATGALATQRFFRIRQPTLAFVAGSTVTDAATVEIDGAPVAGTNATITNPYALRVASGASYFGGNVNVAGNILLDADNTRGIGSLSNSLAYLYTVVRYTKQQTKSGGGALTIDPSLGESAIVVTGGVAITTIAITASSGFSQDLKVIVKQDATGGRAVPTTWTNVTFSGGTYTATATANKADVLSFTWDNTSAKWREVSRSLNQ